MGKSSIELPLSAFVGDLEEKIVAPGAYLFGWISAIIVIVLETKSKYCKFHGWQSLIFSIIETIVLIICIIIDAIIAAASGFGVSIFTLLWFIAFFIIWIILMVLAYTRADSGNPYLLPGIGPFAMKQTDKFFGGSSSTSDSTAPSEAAPA